MRPNKMQRGMLGASASGASASASPSSETEIIKRVTRSEDPLRNQLLLGIANDITLQHIATHWSRGTRQVVARVSRDWQRAFQGRMVYDPRVRSQSTETFFVVLAEISTAPGPKYVDGFGKTRSILSERRILSLFSPREGRWYKLPPVPGCLSGMPSCCEYVLLDGAIFLLGGTRSGTKSIPSAERHILNLALGHTVEWQQYIPSAEVHVLDLAAGHPLEWRRCANMQVPRRDFTVGVMQGKIFVFGGESEGTYPEVRNEVYDPKVDTWSWIAPNIPSVMIRKAFSVGQAFFVCWGWMASNLPGIPAASRQKQKQPRMPPRMNPVSDCEADIRGDTKLVITVDCDRVLRLIYTRDDDAEDKMDDLHEIIEIQLDGLVNCAGSLEPSPAESLESYIEYHERNGEFLGAYDPVKDEWRAIEFESLGTDNVDTVRPNHVLDFLGAPGYDAADGTARVWAVSL